MWNFLPGGLLMPAAVPMNLADPKFTHDGKFDLQVRGRVASHLENFIRDYMEPGTYSDIEYTPQMDYNVRFYTTRNDYAWAMGKAIANIDYEKFKPTAEDKNPKDGKPLYKDGKEYHDVLNSIWGTVTKLGSPGGMWGTYSTSNKNGYRSWKDSPYSAESIGSAYKATGESQWGQIDHVDYGDEDKQVSRGIDFSDMPEDVGSEEFNAWWDKANARALGEVDPDYDPDVERFVIAEKDRAWMRQNLLDEASEFGVPLEDWASYFTADEFALIREDHKAFMDVKRRAARKVRKQRRKARQESLRDTL